MGARTERVLIAGSGYLGTALGLRLSREGARVYGLRRDPRRLPDPIRPLRADLSTGAGLDALPEVDAVVYAAAADRFEAAAYRAIYADGPRRLLDALSGHERFVLVSSTSVYEVDDGSCVDEDTAIDPATETGRALADGERAAREVGGIVLRLAGLYGPGRARLLASVRDGSARLRAGEASWTNRIWRDDAVTAALCALALPEPHGLYLVTDGEPAPWNDVLSGLAGMLGLPAPPVDRRTPAGAGKRCSNARLLATGWTPAVPSWREGYAALLAAEGAR